MRSALKLGLAALLVGSVASVAACSLFGSGSGANAPGLPPDASSAQVSADEVLQGLTAAWNAAVPVCLDAEKAGAFKAGSCASILLPTRDGLMAAGAAIDAWTATSSGNFPCAVADVVKGLVNVETLMIDAKVTVPSEIQSALSIAQGVAAFCPNLPQPGTGYQPPADAGAGG